ncbi:Replication protein A 70 kDa DNA-binding subunit C [Stylophora pistillata]|uniref:Replication protein A 70 kDa DNA-binding subunit C n=1 Tax=Stylophora pistillata TaxID=50429 RepID=A0A2B4SG67_STYPI|nr:Replication protein A 70 kDa DNA-binding subunit C [Stylophora pistillata]
MDSMNVDGLEEMVAQENLESRSTVNGDSYASRAARTIELNDERPVQLWTSENTMPQRPKSAFFTPHKQTSARAVFDAFAESQVSPTEIQCLQRKLNGEVVVTFKSITAKERFLRLNSLNIGSELFALQDIDKPLSFLTIYDAPFELADLAIIKRLAPYCEVLHYRRGKHSYAPNIYNGLRHYRVRIIKPIPSFIRFGKTQIFIKHSGQTPTCRKCNQPDHFSNECPNKICFNCEGVGHEARDCPKPLLCCICKQEGHFGVNCEYSWVFPVVQPSQTDETQDVNVEDLDEVTEDLVTETPTENSTPPSNEILAPDSPDPIDENLPLAAALLPAKNSSGPANNSSDPGNNSSDPANNSSENLPLPCGLPSPNQPNHDQVADLTLVPPPDDFNSPQPEPREQPSEPELSSDHPSQSTVTESPLITSQGFIASIKCAITSSSRRTPAKLSSDSSLACIRKPTQPAPVSAKSRSSIPVPTASLTPTSTASSTPTTTPEAEMEISHDLKRKSSDLSPNRKASPAEKKKGRNRNSKKSKMEHQSPPGLEDQAEDKRRQTE